MRPAGGRLSRSPSFLRLTRSVAAHPFLFSVGAREAVEEEEKGVGLRDGTMRGESLPHPSRRSNPMATSTPKLVLNGARDIPFNKLVPSAANVRKVKAGVSLEELAEDIGRRGLTPEPARPAGARRRRAPRPGCSRSRRAGGASRPCSVSSRRSAWARRKGCPAWCKPTTARPPRKTRWPRTSSARRCIRWTSFARSGRCARSAGCRTRRSRPRSSSRSRS